MLDMCKLTTAHLHVLMGISIPRDPPNKKSLIISHVSYIFFNFFLVLASNYLLYDNNLQLLAWLINSIFVSVILNLWALHFLPLLSFAFFWFSLIFIKCNKTLKYLSTHLAVESKMAVHRLELFTYMQIL